MIRVFIVDDHPIVREGLRSLISHQPDMILVGEANDGDKAISLATTLNPDVLVIDLRMPGLDGLGILRKIQTLTPVPSCLVLSNYNEPNYVIAAIEAGARGFLLKHSAYTTILDAIRAITRGEYVISPNLVGVLFTNVAEFQRERLRQVLANDESALHILKALADGATTIEIGAMLHMSEVTVKRRIQELIKLLGVRNRTQLVAEAVRRGWV
ncbi:response regulator transcription factor [Chloroflexus sp.]|uniref:response regulator transcription factor n=1 Tax=Chloroflexus sp. TaxID=1904827 RepID=UPI002ADE2242|nr:response regulator transcription factor [Chloroflexus sp.]